jgi:hypothetical protein
VFERREIPDGVKRGHNYQMDDTFPKHHVEGQQPTEIIIDAGANGQRVVHFNVRDDSGVHAPVVIGPTTVSQSSVPQPQQVRYSSLTNA